MGNNTSTTQGGKKWIGKWQVVYYKLKKWVVNKSVFFSAYLILIWHTWGLQPLRHQHAQWRVAGQRAGRQSTARLNTDRQTCTHAHIHTYSQFRVSSLPDSHAALWMWEEAIEEEGKKEKKRKRTHANVRKLGAGRAKRSNLGLGAGRR